MRRIFLLMFVLSAIGTIFILKTNSNAPANLPQYSPEQLKQFNGTDPAKPIYLALDGFIYDVTEGKEYYQKGGAYHSLAGKDSSDMLHLAGGAIIKRKYKVIGILKS